MSEVLQRGGTWPIVGHDVAVDQLARAAQSGRVNHAYLITGPGGIGRFSLARAFAQALVCSQPVDERPCQSCSRCRRVREGIFPDVTLLSLETQSETDRRDSRNTVISIESIRELRSSVSMRPMEAAWRVAILLDADRLSFNAYDALLKTLEEPPPFVVLILVATEFEALPETIRSRCRHLALEPVPRRLVTNTLIERGTDPERAELVARLTRGRIGTALELSDDDEALSERRERVDTALQMMADPLEALIEARKLADLYRRGQRDRVAAMIDLLIGLWRDTLLLKANQSDQISNVDVISRLETFAREWQLGEVERAISACYQAMHDLSVNVQPRIALNTMVIQWPETSVQ